MRAHKTPHSEQWSDCYKQSTIYHLPSTSYTAHTTVGDLQRIRLWRHLQLGGRLHWDVTYSCDYVYSREDTYSCDMVEAPLQLWHGSERIIITILAADPLLKEHLLF